MRQPWQIFALVLTIMLTAVLLFTIIAIGWEIGAVGSSGETVLTEWSNGIGRDTGNDGRHTFRNDDVPTRNASSTSELSGASTIAMILFAFIPFITYAATALSFLRHRRWAYLVMALLQIIVLSSVAIPVITRIVT